MYPYLTLLEAWTLDLKKIDFQKTLDAVTNYGLIFLMRLIIAIIIIFIGKKLINLIVHILKKYFKRTKVELSVSSFLITLIKAALYIILIALIVIQIVGIKGTSVAALIGSAGLSIGLVVGLALQGGLANFAGGVLILILKPFRLGDYVVISDKEGTVTSIDIFYTRLLTFDNKLVIMPNGALSNANIVNVTKEPNRRLDLNISINYTENIQKVKEILMDIAQNKEEVLKDQKILVFVNSLDPSAINIGFRVWVINENYWTVKWELLEQILQEFDENHITIPFNQLDVNIRNDQMNIDNLGIEKSQKIICKDNSEVNLK